MKKSIVFLLWFLVFIGIAIYANRKNASNLTSAKTLKIYWFVPDGLRAENTVFKIYQWAKNGELPNLKYLMENGSYGYSRPVFPSHTPVNYATLMTGTWPEVHGVTDGPMRLEGYPLTMILKGGFSSTAKNVPPIWVDLEEKNNLVSLLSVPGSTPPELSQGNTIRGRWGNWGIDFPSVNFGFGKINSQDDVLDQDQRVFNIGNKLFKQIAPKKATNWAQNISAQFKNPQEVDLTYWRQPLFALFDDQNKNVVFSSDKKNILATLKDLESSVWLPNQLYWQTKNDYTTTTPKKSEWENNLSEIPINSFYKITLIKNAGLQGLRIRLVYDSINELNVFPYSLSKEIHDSVGPFVDFVDNYPPQLIHLKEDKQVFLNEMFASFKNHIDMVPFLIKNKKSNVIIHSIYNPNQMLTSRWWLPYLDPKSPRYNDVTEQDRVRLWEETKHMYVAIDQLLGEIIKNKDDNTYIVFSSDHGAVPLWKEVRLNNLFLQKGWLKTKYDSKTKESIIDWDQSQVVFTQMNHVYINPNGLGGPYHRAYGEKYKQLRNQVIEELKNLKDPQTQASILSQYWVWEDAAKIRLPKERIGDLVIANSAYYVWAEPVTTTKEIFKISLKGGYKQAVDNTAAELLTPFLVYGPGVKKNHELSRIIDHADQYPTIMKLLHYQSPSFVQGKIIEEIFN